MAVGENVLDVQVLQIIRLPGVIIEVSEILAKEERVEVLAAVILNALCPEWLERCGHSGELRLRTSSGFVLSVRGYRLLRLGGKGFEWSQAENFNLWLRFMAVGSMIYFSSIRILVLDKI